MPLINLQTDLKSLKFGGDRPGGGDSKEPFIRVPIPPQNQSTTGVLPSSIGTGTFGLGAGPLLETISSLTTGGLGDLTGIGSNDIIIRGGSSSITRSALDSIRITRFLSTTRGILFLAKQNQLSQSGVRTQGSGKLNDLSYTGISTLGQTVGNAFGLHLLKQGKNNPETTGFFGQIADAFTGPLVGSRDDAKPDRYLDNADPLRNNNLTTDNNRLVALKNAIDTNSSTTVNGIILNKSDTTLLSYRGGPSTFGISGETNIKFADANQRTGKNNPFLLETGFYNGVQNSPGTLFDLSNVAQGVSSFVQGGLSNLSNQDGFKGFIGRTLGQLIDFERGDQFTILADTQISAFRNNIEDVLSVNPLGPQSNFSVFKRPSTTLNFNNYVRLSNLYGNIVSTPREFGQNQNAINNDGSRGATFDFNVYDSQGIGNISKTNPELQNKNGGKTWTQKEIIEGGDNNPVGIFGSDDVRGAIKEDFRNVIVRQRGVDRNKKVISLSPDYRTRNYEKRANAGNPGALPDTPQNTGVYNYAIPAQELKALNRINALEPYTTLGREIPTNDLLTLRFAILNSKRRRISNEDDAPFSAKKTYVQFPAYIDNFADSYTSDFSSVQYAGRAESFYNYQGFERQIQLSFTVAAESKAELVPMYRKLNYLASSLAPAYSQKGFMKGNIVELTYGWYLRDVPGILTSFNMSVPQESPYEINVGSSELQAEFGYIDDNTVGELPLIIKVDLSFTPIHSFLPQIASNGVGEYTNNPNSKFMSLTDGQYSLYGINYATPQKYRSTTFGNFDTSTIFDGADLASRIGTPINSTPLPKVDPTPYNAILSSGQANFSSYINTNDPNFQPLPNDPTSLTGGNQQISLGGGGY